MQTMLAARYLGPHRIEAVTTPIPDVRTGEALIRVEACGFCGSDLGIVAGVHPRAKAPLTLGHEFCGRIVDVTGDANGFHTGELVTSFPLISCGACYVCRNGNPHVCRNLRLYGFDADGGMAQFVKVATASLVSLPPDMSSTLGAVIEPLAVAVHGVSQALALGEYRTAVVLGAGPIGILTALVARARGIQDVLISDVVDFRRQLAGSLGLRAIAAGEDLRAYVQQATSGDGVDLVFECAGVAATAAEMTALARPRGTIVNLGVFKKPVNVDMQAVNFRELTIAGSRVYTRQDFEAAVNLASALPIDKIVTHSFPLHDVTAAFQCFETGDDVCKVLVLPNVP
jgi:2-desacetyl-2-hydroxyethyl bacteriochlorophyllide A dehydrogenase